MLDFTNIKRYTSLLFFLVLLSSCKSEYRSTEHIAYFGGEIVNPNNQFVLFCKDNKVIDTLRLNEKNRFFTQFDSLAPGLYTFKHEP